MGFSCLRFLSQLVKAGLGIVAFRGTLFHPTEDRLLSSVGEGLRPVKFHKKPARDEQFANEGRREDGFFDPIVAAVI